MMRILGNEAVADPSKVFFFIIYFRIYNKINFLKIEKEVK